MRIMQTNSYLSSQNTIKYTGNQNTLRHGINQNNSKVLVSGTGTNRQADKTKKQNGLEKMFQELKTTADDYGKYLTDVLEYHSAAARKFAEMIKSSGDEIEKICEERVEQNRQEQRADGVEAGKIMENGASESTETISDTKISSEIVDSPVVEKPEYVPISAYRAQVSSSESHIDVKL